MDKSLENFVAKVHEINYLYAMLRNGNGPNTLPHPKWILWKVVSYIVIVPLSLSLYIYTLPHPKWILWKVVSYIVIVPLSLNIYIYIYIYLCVCVIFSFSPMKTSRGNLQGTSPHCHWNLQISISKGHVD